MGNPGDLSTMSAAQAREGRAWEVLLLVSSLLAAFFFCFAAYRENRMATWRTVQESYRSTLMANASDEAGRRSAASFEIRYYQYYLPDLDRIDRCPTCHVSVENPLTRDLPQPLRTHPGDILTYHPPDIFGCTVCHGGQGRATEEVEAHGLNPHRLAPLRTGELLEVACAQCHSDTELPGVPTYNLARALFADKACLSCHMLRGVGGTLGPDLTDEAGKQTLEWHIDHFLDPVKVVPGSKMPGLELTEEEARALAYLMLSFTGETFGRGYIPTPGAGRSSASPGQLSVEALGSQLDPGAAEGYVGSETCLICHRGLHPDAMEGWENSKMAHAFLSVRDVPDRELCIPCHTTGYNPETERFAESGVACEACHGPGRDYVPEILAGDMMEHKARAIANVREQNPCVRCHQPHVPNDMHEEVIRKSHDFGATGYGTGK